MYLCCLNTHVRHTPGFFCSELKCRYVSEANSTCCNVCQDYIKQMIDVMHVAEDVETLDSLHALCTLMQTIRKLSPN